MIPNEWKVNHFLNKRLKNYSELRMLASNQGIENALTVKPKSAA